MSRTLVTTTDLPMDTKSDLLTWTDADATNNHYYVDDGNSILLVQNGDTGGAKTATITSVADALGRTGDLSVVVPVNNATNDSLGVVGLPSGTGWRQAGTNQIFVTISAATKTRLACLRVNRFA